MRLAWSGAAAPALIVGGPDAAAALGSLAVVPAGALAAPDAFVPMAGRWEAAADGVRFVPGLPFARGVTYVVVRREDRSELGRIERPGPGLDPTATVLAIDPDVPEVPENLLRLAVTFSEPMEEGSAAGGVRLEVDGRELAQAVLPMPPELWDRSRRRLTLLLEPGRIKRGLVPNTALGAPLAGVHGFDVVVDAAIRGASGAGLVGGARRRYRVGPPIRSRVDPSSWRVTWPEPGSHEALTVAFDRPMDRTLALRCLRVTAAGTVVGGRVGFRGATEWLFMPEAAWATDALELHVDTTLEDVAGNSVRRVFDRDLAVDPHPPLAARTTVIRAPRIEA